MTTRWPHIVVATLCCLLAVATSASAKGAWVLWAFLTDENKALEYSVEAAHPTKQKCLRDMRERAAAMKAKGYTVSGGEPSSPYVIGENGSMSRKYFCLPDTVDPRGVKAK